jgi:hypothetical protein
LINLPLLLLSGFFANSQNFAPYVIPLQYISPYKYMYQSLVNNEFDNLTFNCFNMDTENCSTYTVKLTIAETLDVSIASLLLITVLFNLLAFTFIYKYARVKV